MPENICQRFLETAQKQPDRVAIVFKKARLWHELTWSDYHLNVESAAAGLQVLGVRKGDRVAVLSNTRYEWAAVDLAILGLGGVTVPIYPNSTNDDVAYILENSEARVLFIESDSEARKISTILQNAKHLECVVVFEKNGEDPLPEKYFTLADLQKRGQQALKSSPSLFDLAVKEVSPQDFATIVYTSGTTGRPKGVLHCHAQILSEVGDCFPLLGVNPKDRSLTFLPFAHVLGRIEIWGHALIGYTMCFAQGVDRLKEDLQEIKPTVLVAVPRIFEKLYTSIQVKSEIGVLRNRTFRWALDIGREISRHKIEKRSPSLDLALKYRLAHQLVFSELHRLLGGELRFAVCGGAPLSAEIAEFFHAAGLLILEGYGLSETLAAITVNTPFSYRFGTVGKPVGDVKIKIAEDGEILVQSKKVMRGYYKDPEATAEALKDGWLHTGDIGEISSDGFVRITDRKKDLIKTAGGKYVAPQRLEALLKNSRFISNVHITGDQRKFIVALITLNMAAVKTYANEHRISFTDHKNLIENPKIKALLREAVAEANSHLATFESIKNFALLPEDFTIESGELTPSLKVKRKVVEKKYADLIEQLYGNGT